MINFEKELAAYQPSLEVDEAGYTVSSAPQEAQYVSVSLVGLPQRGQIMFFPHFLIFFSVRRLVLPVF